MERSGFMAKKYERKKGGQNNVLYTVTATFLLCVIFLFMVNHLYDTAEADAYENLHIQTKQIKDNISLQILSDRENLATMASFASKLYADGEDYSIMFESFKPIGLIENIGILDTHNTFITKAGSIDLDGLISFTEEEQRGAYISGRIKDLTHDGYEIIRTAVPIKVKESTVGILYGVIKLDTLRERYNAMAQELDAQLFVYEAQSGDLVIDSVHEKLGNISFLKDREYNEGYSYEQIATNENGFSSFISAYNGENVHMHYSSIDEIGWKIALVRYDSQVFTETHELTSLLILIYAAMIAVMVLYITIVLVSDNLINSVTECASEVRRELLETIDGQNNIFDALTLVCDFAKSRSVQFFDTKGDDYKYISPKHQPAVFTQNDRHYFKTELFRYASELNVISNSAINVMCITPNLHLKKTNSAFYDFLKERDIFNVSFAAIVNGANNITVLGTINAKKPKAARMLAEKTVACFSMALYNKNHMTKTEIAATTDSLTGVLNRVSYQNDIALFDGEQPSDFSCIYVDVNELHLCNNKYGHAAGDEMLMYIANAMKKEFEGQSIYRIGGDEFLVFAKNTSLDKIKSSIHRFLEQINIRNYHVAIGVSFRTHNINTEEMVKEAEVKMYESKAEYYQNKEKTNASMYNVSDYVQVKTGMPEIDTILSILKENYNGIYRVSLDTDKARRILMPAYLGYNESEEHFSALYSKYVEDSVDPDYHRAMLGFMNYEAIKRRISDGKTPCISYKKTDGEDVVLSVYNLSDSPESISDTLWVFAKE